jgi:hypothetical protein
MGHDAESFFILDEGLVDASLGGRRGIQEDRVSDPEAPPPVPLSAKAPPPFRFSRIGPRGRQLSDQNLEKVATAMVRGGRRPAAGLPAGFTYLGQFVDHDLTADITDVELGQPPRCPPTSRRCRWSSRWRRSASATA